jgi:hypothetical protein
MFFPDEIAPGSNCIVCYLDFGALKLFSVVLFQSLAVDCSLGSLIDDMRGNFLT